MSFVSLVTRDPWSVGRADRRVGRFPKPSPEREPVQHLHLHSQRACARCFCEKKNTKPRTNDISTVREALMWTEAHLQIAQSL